MFECDCSDNRRFIVSQHGKGWLKTVDGDFTENQMEAYHFQTRNEAREILDKFGIVENIKRCISLLNANAQTSEKIGCIIVCGLCEDLLYPLYL